MMHLLHLLAAAVSPLMLAIRVGEIIAKATSTVRARRSTPPATTEPPAAASLPDQAPALASARAAASWNWSLRSVCWWS